ncbi:MAG TPA: CocE/NonD family hydrolase [Gaiellaceae bacterium]|nr:CocE/NonD family hydrolase [Gaiellaceae bacterium]
MRRSRLALVAAVAMLACGGAASAVLAGTRGSAPATQELTVTVSDGTPLACGLVLPAGQPPAGGWPGLLLFPGLGETHAALDELASEAFAPAGFASLSCDPRGTGGSGGQFGLDGPREVQDARDLFAWLAARPDVSDTRIGAVGLSLGGGEVWNAAAAGVPFAAIVPVAAWTDLARALAPDGVPKSGLIASLEPPGTSWQPPLAKARDDLLGGSVTRAAAAALAARSSLRRLRSLTVPTLILQGRHDFLFDLDQALDAYRALRGPKRLYLGDLGHAPATNPPAEEPHYLSEIVAWLRRYLAGGPPLAGGVELAHDPWDGSTSRFRGLPRTRRVSVALPGTTTLTGAGSLRRAVRLPGGPLETFGDGAVSVRYTGATPGWTQLVATVSVQGRRTPVTEGAARVPTRAGVVRIPLLDEAVLLPRGRRLVVALGASSADGVYRAPAGSTTASITIGRVTLGLSVLWRAVSK